MVHKRHSNPATRFLLWCDAHVPHHVTSTLLTSATARAVATTHDHSLHLPRSKDRIKLIHMLQAGLVSPKSTSALLRGIAATGSTNLYNRPLFMPGATVSDNEVASTVEQRRASSDE